MKHAGSEPSNITHFIFLFTFVFRRGSPASVSVLAVDGIRRQKTALMMIKFGENHGRSESLHSTGKKRSVDMDLDQVQRN